MRAVAFLRDRADARVIEYGLMGATIAIALMNVIENVAMTLNVTFALLQNGGH